MIGRTLTAKDHDSLKIVGVSGNEFVVENLTSFGPVRRMTAEDRKIYGFYDPLPQPKSYSDGWAELGRRYG